MLFDNINQLIRFINQIRSLKSQPNGGVAFETTSKSDLEYSMRRFQIHLFRVISYQIEEENTMVSKCNIPHTLRSLIYIGEYIEAHTD